MREIVSNKERLITTLFMNRRIFDSLKTSRMYEISSAYIRPNRLLYSQITNLGGKLRAKP